MTKAERVAEQLKHRGIKVIKIHHSDCPDVEDDAVFLENDRHVSIGCGYVSLVKVVDGKLYFTDIKTMGELVSAINSDELS